MWSVNRGPERPAEAVSSPPTRTLLLAMLPHPALGWKYELVATEEVGPPRPLIKPY